MDDRFNDEWAVVATIDPQNLDAGAGTAVSAWTDAIDASKFSEIAFVVLAGAIEVSTNVNFKVYSDSATATAGMTASVASITQLGPSDDNKQVVVSIPTNKLANVNSGDRYVRGKLTVSGIAGAGAFIGVLALGGKPKYGPADDYDLSSVAEVVEA